MKIVEYKLHGNPNGKGMVTPGFIQKFFSVFKAEDKDKNNSQESNEEDAEN